MYKVLLLWLFSILSGMHVSAQALYYVDQNNGDDSFSGDSSNPWKTIQKACNAATPNSTVYIKSGTYHENIIVNVSGTAGNPIVFKNYMDDIVNIDGTGTSLPWLLRISDKSYLTFENLVFKNLVMNNARGILLETTTGTSTKVNFINLTIRNIQWTSDLTAIPTSSDNAKGLSVKGGDGGVTYLVIDNCRIYNNVLGYSEAMVLSGNVSNFSITNCIVHDNDNIGIDLAGNYGVSSNPSTDHVRSGVVQRNICYSNISPSATSAGIYVDGGQDIIIEKNTCYDNGIGIEVGCEQNGASIYIMVKNNIIYNNHYTGFAVGGYNSQTTGQVLACTFRNNTLLQNNSYNTGAGEISITKASNCIFEDNLFYTNNQNVFFSAENISPQNGNLLNYNCWFTPSDSPDDVIIHWKTFTYSSFLAYKLATQQELNSMYANPGLLNPVIAQPDLNLLNSSYCINTGNPVLALNPGETDYYGNPRIISGAIDIGAIEYQSALGNHQSIFSLLKSSVYPNPFINETVIYSPTAFENGTLMLFDSRGTLVKKLNNLSGNNINLQRDNLTSGLYYYKIYMDNMNIASGKIIAK